jgi:hypothetical protein
MLNQQKAFSSLKSSFVKLHWEMPRPIQTSTDFLDTIMHNLSPLNTRVELPAESELSEELKLQFIRNQLTELIKDEVSDSSEFYDPIYNMLVQLAILYPPNPRIYKDEQGNDFAEETWLDPHSNTLFNRNTQAMVIDPELGITNYFWYQAQFWKESSYDDEMHPILGGKPFNSHRLALMESQNISFYNIFRGKIGWGGASIGKLAGSTLGAGLAIAFNFYCAFFTPLPFLSGIVCLLSAGIIGYYARPKYDSIISFMVAFDALNAFSGLCWVLSGPILDLLVSHSLLSSAAAVTSLTLLTNLVIPLAAPLLMLTVAGVFAWYKQQNFAISLSQLNSGIFLVPATVIFREIGNAIENGITNSYRFIKRSLGFVEVTGPSVAEPTTANFSSYQQINESLGFSVNTLSMTIAAAIQPEQNVDENRVVAVSANDANLGETTSHVYTHSSNVARM